MYYLLGGDLLMNCLSTSRQVQAVSSLVEGNSINATCRMTGIAKHTVLKLLKDIGCACAAYHNAQRQMRPYRQIPDENFYKPPERSFEVPRRPVFHFETDEY